MLPNWFERLVGFSEVSPTYVRENLVLDGEFLRSRINGRELRWGRFDVPSLAELRERVSRLAPAVQEIDTKKRLRLHQVVANVQDLHKNKANAGALFQVASQFNLLEMASPDRIPEDGVGIYQDDPTQGPSCAVAVGAGTIYRNYFVPIRKLQSDGLVVVEQVGQSADHQVDALADLGAALGNDSSNRLWSMCNGYVMASSREALLEIQGRLRSANETERDSLRQLLRVGLQLSAQVTLDDCTQCVSQVYCSALPVGYSPYKKELWGEFARLVLEATYEATICAAILNAAEAAPYNHKVFLTLVGGGVFANEPAWILHALERALNLYQGFDLDVSIVSHRSSNAAIGALVDRWNSK
jgi:hypothetical protein